MFIYLIRLWRVFWYVIDIEQTFVPLLVFALTQEMTNVDLFNQFMAKSIFPFQSDRDYCSRILIKLWLNCH